MHSAHEKAIDFVRSYAQTRQSSALSLLQVVCSRSNTDPSTIQFIIQNIAQKAHIAVHFQPDRLDGNGSSVVDSLLKSGRYQNQFVTMVSNGQLSPRSDGPRAKWEDMLFENAYTESDLSLRPKYGSLSLLPSPYGPSPRFGSCHLLLTPELLKSSTFTYGDSSDNPPSRGTIDVFEDVLASLLKDSFLCEQVLGYTQIRPSQLLSHLSQDLSSSKHLNNCQAIRNLNQYIEAQIHGEIRLLEHATTLVADPSFRQTPTGDSLHALCEKYDISLHWYPRLKLHVDDVPDDYRGAQMSATARKITTDGWIDAKKIGRATIAAVQQPKTWSEFTDPPERLLKYLWHTLIRFGYSE